MARPWQVCREQGGKEEHIIWICNPFATLLSAKEQAKYDSYFCVSLKFGQRPEARQFRSNGNPCGQKG